MSLQLLDATHTYLLYGREIPGCTRCIDHSGLTSFEFVRDEILMRRSVLGKEAHRACQFFAEGTLDETSVDRQVQPYLDSFRRLIEKTRFKPTLLEHECLGQMDGLVYGMRLDFSGILFDAEAIADMKIGLPHWAHGVQLAGYAVGLPHDELATAYARFIRRTRWGIYLQADGSMAKLRQYQNKRDYQTFLAILETSSRKMLEGIKVRKLEEIDDGCAAESAA